jgi:hypothetical protein
MQYGVEGLLDNHSILLLEIVPHTAGKKEKKDPVTGLGVWLEAKELTYENHASGLQL